VEGRGFSILSAALTVSVVLVATAAPARAEEEPSRGLSQKEIEAWLESRSLPTDVATEAPPEAPPPPPRDYGFVVEASVGALGHVGDMKNISPTAPWFHVQLGWEPVRWAMLIALADAAFGNTSYASRPPEPRGYVLYGFGAGARLTVEPADWFGLFLQGEVGAAELSSDILSTYGFDDADSLSPYFGGMLGFEWYQVSPHMALVAEGGVRDYVNLLDRPFASSTPLAWIGALALQYTF
jgi:hypothetical protein